MNEICQLMLLNPMYPYGLFHVWLIIGGILLGTVIYALIRRRNE